MADATELQDDKVKTTEAEEQTSQVQAKAAEFPEAGAGQDTGSGGIDMILNMSVPVTVAVGQTKISIQRLLQLGPGSVLKLDKSVSEPMELYLNGSKFATGEVVVIDDQFGIKINTIVDLKGSQAEEATA